MLGLGPTELIIILVIVIVLFGAGRVSKIGGELGSAISEFRAGISKNEESAPEEVTKEAIS